MPAGRLSALTAGEGEPVVLLHGVPTGAELWRAVLSGLACAGFRGIAPDLPGYGQTRLRAGADFSLGGVARLLARWLSDCGLAPAWVVGHDLGGAVAALLAAQHGGVVSRLTLTNSVAHGAWPAPRARFSILAARAGLYRPGAALRLAPNGYLRREIRRGFADPATLAAVDSDRIFWDGKFTDPSGRDQFQRHLAALTPADTAVLPTRLPAVRIPAQLVWGMADIFQTWQVPGRRMQRLLPGAAVSRLEGCGHFTPLECPDRLLAALLDWRAGRPPADPAP